MVGEYTIQNDCFANVALQLRKNRITPKNTQRKQRMNKYFNLNNAMLKQKIEQETATNTIDKNLARKIIKKVKDENT